MVESLVNVNREQATQPVVTLILGVARALVDDFRCVAVSVADDEQGTTLVLTVASADLGKLIGKQGRIARSMRVLLQAASMQLGHHFSLSIQAAGDSAAQPTP